MNFPASVIFQVGDTANYTLHAHRRPDTYLTEGKVYACTLVDVRGEWLTIELINDAGETVRRERGGMLACTSTLESTIPEDILKSRKLAYIDKMEDAEADSHRKAMKKFCEWRERLNG